MSVFITEKCYKTAYQCYIDDVIKQYKIGALEAMEYAKHNWNQETHDKYRR